MDDVNDRRRAAVSRNTEDTDPRSTEAQKADAQTAEAKNTADKHLVSDDEVADEWGKESFPGSDPPANY